MSNRNKRFKPISVVVKTDRFGRTELSNTLEGLTEYRYVKNDRHFKKILRVPIVLLGIYQDENERFYEVSLAGNIIRLPKARLIDYIEKKTDLFYISGKKLRTSISIILRALEERDTINQKERF